MAALMQEMSPGAHVAWLDRAQAMYQKALLKRKAAISIARSTNHRFCVLIIGRRCDQSSPA
jgi:hypothetical protein